MKILIAASEMSPLAKAGGLGDVIGALPEVLAKLGNDVKVFLPHYSRFIDSKVAAITKTSITGSVEIDGRRKSYEVLQVESKLSAYNIFLISNDKYFGREGIYVDPETGKGYTDDDERFIFFCRSVLNAVQQLKWQPEIIQVHDWQTALIPAYLKTVEKGNTFFAGSKSVLTLHNVSYQGRFSADRYPVLGLPIELFQATEPFEFYGEVNFLKGGISFADKITTVSETYASEIKGEQGCGLEGVLQNRSDDLSGILNGADYRVWSPGADKKIPYNYRVSNLSGKRMNKVELLNEANLPVREGTPLIGMITRLVEQKGLQLVITAAEQLFLLDLQMIILGTGDKNIESELEKLQDKYPSKLKVYLEFDEVLAHKIEAASDMFLMPSLFEPCGLNQIYSLKYGTPPIVHNVGGLADTVVDFNPETREGTGFVFEQFNSEAMMSAIERAIDIFGNKRVWTKLMKNGMNQNFSWDSSAKKYHKLFQSLY